MYFWLNSKTMTEPSSQLFLRIKITCWARLALPGLYLKNEKEKSARPFGEVIGYYQYNMFIE